MFSYCFGPQETVAFDLAKVFGEECAKTILRVDGARAIRVSRAPVSGRGPMVGRLLWEQDFAGSSLAVPTEKRREI